MTVNFISNGSTIATMYVKNSDTAEDIEMIVFDPGVGTLEDGQLFQGWSLVEEYSKETPSYTVPEIRDYIAGLGDWAEGTVLNIYARIFKTYSVTYLDPKNISMGSDVVLLPISETSATYKVSLDYDPESDTQLFEGWNVKSGSSHIEGYTEGKLYNFGDTITISGDVVFSTNVADGHWLVFDENGKGATYNAPRFVKSGDVTTDEGLLEMKRVGYTFDGWYTNKECTAPFTFGGELEDNLTIYAKWNANTTADYVILIWKQNVNDSKNAADSAKTYDFAESITLNGNVGTTVNSVTAAGTGNSRYASINGTAKRYPGFHLRTYDTNVTITPEGTSLVNIYYDRNLVTLTFVHREYYGWSSQWVEDQTMTGLYGSKLESNGYTWPTNRWWYDSYSSWGGEYEGAGTRTTFLDAFKLSNDGDSQTFYGFAGSGNNNVTFYKKNTETGYYEEKNTVTSSGGTFYISDKYNGYKAVAYSKNGTSWTALGDKDPQTGYYATVTNWTNLYILYDPLVYNILYMDGVYVDGDGKPVQGYESRGQLKKVENIPFESSVDSYNVDKANYYAPTYSGFTFGGWYTDDQCRVPYTFTTMPEGITVYAKWVLNQYRVFLHPNAGIDASLDWGSDSQKMSFRVSNGNKISLPTGTRNEYNFIGWYTDEGRKSVYPSATVLNDSTEYLKDYDQIQPTELNKWGDPESDENKDAQENRFWVIKKLDLYGKWSEKVPGADGIGVIYNPDGGTNPPTDTTLYKDNVDSVAQGASTAPVGKQFECWMVQIWSDAENAYVDTEDLVYPGDSFTVLKSKAKIVVSEWVNPNNESDVIIIEDPQPGTTPPDGTHTKINRAVYTMQLKAVYVDAEAPTPTHITWYGNGGNLKNALTPGEGYSVDSGTVTTTYIGLQINEKVPAASADTFERPGYKFVGWARITEPTGAFDDETHTVDESKYSVDDNLELWLKLNDDGLTYTEVGTDNTDITEVAADESAPYHALYAVWEAEYFYIFHSGTGDLEAVIVTDSVDLTDYVTDGYLYGGYYSGYGAHTVTDENKAAAAAADTKKANVTSNTYDGTSLKFGTTRYWTKTNAAKVLRDGTAVAAGIGTEIAPLANDVYYIKEVPTCYLQTKARWVYDWADNYNINTIYLLTGVDDTYYSKIGFYVIDDENVAKLYASFNYQHRNSDTVHTVTATDLIGQRGYIGLVDGSQYISGIESGEVSVVPFWVTLDGVTVTTAGYKFSCSESGKKLTNNNIVYTPNE